MVPSLLHPCATLLLEWLLRLPGQSASARSAHETRTPGALGLPGSCLPCGSFHSRHWAPGYPVLQGHSGLPPSCPSGLNPRVPSSRCPPCLMPLNSPHYLNPNIGLSPVQRPTPPPGRSCSQDLPLGCWVDVSYWCPKGLTSVISDPWGSHSSAGEPAFLNSHGESGLWALLKQKSPLAG